MSFKKKKTILGYNTLLLCVGQGGGGGGGIASFLKHIDVPLVLVCGWLKKKFLLKCPLEWDQIITTLLMVTHE